MSNRRRLRRLKKKLQNTNLSQEVKDLVLDLAFPPIWDEDMDESERQEKARENAVDWLKRRHEIALIQQNSPYKPEVKLKELIYKYTETAGGTIYIGEYGEWPEHLKPYEDIADGQKAAELMYKFDIEPEEYE